MKPFAISAVAASRSLASCAFGTSARVRSSRARRGRKGSSGSTARATASFALSHPSLRSRAIRTPRGVVGSPVRVMIDDRRPIAGDPPSFFPPAAERRRPRRPRCAIASLSSTSFASSAPSFDEVSAASISLRWALAPLAAFSSRPAASFAAVSGLTGR